MVELGLGGGFTVSDRAFKFLGFFGCRRCENRNFAAVVHYDNHLVKLEKATE